MPDSLRKTTTIVDVAKRAGVSISTASRALTGRGYSSPDTKQRVEDAAHLLGYKPHGSARSLKLQRTDTIALIIADIVNPFYSFLAEGVLERAGQLGYHVMLCVTNEEPDTEAEYLELLMEKRVDGILTIPTGRNLNLWKEAIDLGISVVLVDRELSGIRTDAIVIDNVRAGYEATKYLIGLGHRRIGVICGKMAGITTAQGRLQGYRQALAEADIAADPELVELDIFKQESAIRAAEKLLTLPDRPTAIFATNNIFGRGALIAVRAQGLHIPEDVSVVVFDDAPWTSLTSPRMTVVAQHEHELGWVGMERMAQRLRPRSQAAQLPQKTLLSAELIERESCAPPRTFQGSLPYTETRRVNGLI